MKEMKLEKIKKSIKKDYKMPHLYLDQLIEIEDCIKEAGYKNYDITSGDYKYQNINEIPKDTKATNEFSLHIGFLYLILSLYQSNAYFEIRDNSLKSIGLFNKIDKILRGCERKVLWFFSIIGIYGLVTIAFLVFFVYFLEEIENTILDLTLFSILVLFIIWAPIAWYFHFKKYSIIEFIAKDKKQNFFIRNKDDLIKIIITAVITGIVGFFIGKVF